MRKKSSRNIGRKFIAKKTSESAQQGTSNGLTSSQEVFHAKIFPMPDSGQVLMESDQDCSLKPFAWFENCNREQLCWRTWQRCLLEGWTEFSGRWPRSGMMQNGIAYRLPTLVPRISGTECSYWPTTRANDAEKGVDFDAENPRNGLPAAVKLWPTPDANCGNRGPAKDPQATHRPSGAQRQMTINDAVKMFPTPTSRMHKDNGKSPSELNRNSETLAVKAGGRLNPTWVEWLMGFPLGWTDLEDSETQ